MSEPGFETITVEHPNGCIAQGTLNDAGEFQPLRAWLEVSVPSDRSAGWTGVSCGACGQDLVEVTGDGAGGAA